MFLEFAPGGFLEEVAWGLGHGKRGEGAFKEYLLDSLGEWQGASKATEEEEEEGDWRGSSQKGWLPALWPPSQYLPNPTTGSNNPARLVGHSGPKHRVGEGQGTPRGGDW